MADYQQMYLTMVRAARDAQELADQAQMLLVKAMQECEELYINAPEKNVIVIGQKEIPVQDD